MNSDGTLMALTHEVRERKRDVKYKRKKERSEKERERGGRENRGERK